METPRRLIVFKNVVKRTLVYLRVSATQNCRACGPGTFSFNIKHWYFWYDFLYKFCISIKNVLTTLTRCLRVPPRNVLYNRFKCWSRLERLSRNENLLLIFSYQIFSNTKKNFAALNQLNATLLFGILCINNFLIRIFFKAYLIILKTESIISIDLKFHFLSGVLQVDFYWFYELAHSVQAERSQNDSSIEFFLLY